MLVCLALGAAGLGSPFLIGGVVLCSFRLGWFGVFYLDVVFVFRVVGLVLFLNR